MFNESTNNQDVTMVADELAVQNLFNIYMAIKDQSVLTDKERFEILNVLRDYAVLTAKSMRDKFDRGFKVGGDPRHGEYNERRITLEPKK